MLTRIRLLLAAGLLIALVAGSAPSAAAANSNWVVYNTSFGPSGASHLEGVPDNVLDGYPGTTYDVVQDQVSAPLNGASIRVQLRPQGGFGFYRFVKEIRVTVHVGAPLPISFRSGNFTIPRNDVYVAIGGGIQPGQLIKQWIMNAASVPPGTTVGSGQIFSWTGPTTLMDDIYVTFGAGPAIGSGSNDILNNPIGFAEIEVIEDELPGVRVQVSNPAMTPNAEGWYAQNPLEVSVTLHCNAFLSTDTCLGPLRVIMDPGAGAPPRFQVYDADVLHDDPHIVGPCTVLKNEAGPYTLRAYAAECLVSMKGGETATLRWRVWVQPSQDSWLTPVAIWDPTDILRPRYGSDSYAVQIEGARIHPLVFIPGILGTMPPEYAETAWMDPMLDTYSPLLINLQRMGYELFDPHNPLKPATLFPFPYDWRRSNDDSADVLALAIPQALALGNTLPYVREPATGQPATQVDLVVHSMGGLVTRAYVQRPGYPGNVRKVVFIASPHRGFPVDYRIWEGFTWDMFLYRFQHLPLRALMDGVIWPNFVFKKYNPNPTEMVLAGCNQDMLFTPLIDCPFNAFVHWSHGIGAGGAIQETRGIESLPQMLPTDDVPDYLECAGLAGQDCASGEPNPYGRQYNPWLTSLNAGVQTVADNLGPDNIFVIYGIGSPTDFSYRVGPPELPRWRNGSPIGDPFDPGRPAEGDDLIPAYSTNLKLLLPSIPDTNVAKLSGPEARHKEIMFHPDVQQRLVPTFLTGRSLPFPPSPYVYDFPTQGSPLLFGAGCPINLTVTDPAGRRVGFDPASGAAFSEIAGAIYAAPSTEGQFIIVPEAQTGSYRLMANAFGDGDYTIYVYRLGPSGPMPVTSFTGTVTKGQVLDFKFDHSPIVFEDRFDRPDGTDLGPAWEETAGEWGIVAGQLHVGAVADPCVGWRPCPIEGSDDEAAATLDAGLADRTAPSSRPFPVEQPFRKQVLTKASFDATAFTLETRLRLTVPWPWFRPLVHANLPIWASGLGAEVSFGQAPNGTGGYSVILGSRGRILLLRSDGTVLGSAVTTVSGRDAWRQIKAVRGEDGLIEVYVDEGSGYPKEPQIHVKDDTYPTLGRLGFGVAGLRSTLDVDWVVARPH